MPLSELNKIVPTSKVKTLKLHRSRRDLFIRICIDFFRPLKCLHWTSNEITCRALALALSYRVSSPSARFASLRGADTRESRVNRWAIRISYAWPTQLKRLLDEMRSSRWTRSTAARSLSTTERTSAWRTTVETPSRRRKNENYSRFYRRSITLPVPLALFTKCGSPWIFAKMEVKIFFFSLFRLYTCLEIFLTAVICRKFYYSSFPGVFFFVSRQKLGGVGSASAPSLFYITGNENSFLFLLKNTSKTRSRSIKKYRKKASVTTRSKSPRRKNLRQIKWKTF